MSITFKVDLSNSKAKAFLEYIKTLDFVKVIESKDYELSQNQKNAIDKGIESLNKGYKIPNAKVMSQFREQYPEYFTEE
jgi:hypothetical protein